MPFFILLVLFIVNSSHSNPIDNYATPETRELYTALQSMVKDSHHIMFGQQDATLFGAEGGHSPYAIYEHDNGVNGWMFTTYQSQHNKPDQLCDVRRLTGEYPSVMGFDVGGLKPDILSMVKYLLKKAADRGNIVTVSWHMPNPVTNGKPWISQDHGNYSHSIKHILPGGDHHNTYNGKLDILASWIKSLYNAHGKLIPILFRPFHEMNGGWFWWGTSQKVGNTPDDFKQLYAYTVKYLKDNKGVHNVLYAYSPNTDFHHDNYLDYYPGDRYIDLLGLDHYFTKPFTPALTDFQHAVVKMVQEATSRNKLAALTEVGIFNNGINTHHNFWKDHVLDVLKQGHNSTKIAYVLAWANHCFHGNRCELWTPYKGHPAADNFLNFFRDAMTVFHKTLNQLHPQIIG